MKILTRSFGEIVFQEEDIIRLTDGLLGFSNLKNYIIVESPEEDLFVWFQSIDNPEIAFPLLEPEVFHGNYNFDLSDWDQRKLEISSRKDVRVFNIITIPEDVTLMTANMKAPLLINVNTRRAKQIVLQEPAYQIKTAIFVELQKRLSMPNVSSIFSTRKELGEPVRGIIIPEQDRQTELNV